MVTVVVGLDYDARSFDIVEFGQKFHTAGKSTMTELLEIAKKQAIEDYKSKRKTSVPLSSSIIIGTFSYEIEKRSAFEYIGIAFTRAPYGVYVDEGHKTKNGRFEGYHFMAAGLQAAISVAPEVVLRHFNKI